MQVSAVPRGAGATMRNRAMATALRTVLSVLCLQVWHGSADAATTFSKDVAPILLRHCAACHQPGGASTTALLAFEEARSRAEQIVRTTATRQMPPWLPDAPVGIFANDRRLSEQDIETIRTWVADGALEGSPSEPPAQSGPQWTLGTPDLVLTSPLIALQPGAAGRSRNVVLQVPLDRMRYVRAWEIRVSDPRIVRHLTVTLDASGGPGVFDVEESSLRAGFPRPLFGPDTLSFEWTPGDAPEVAAEGTAWPIGPAVPPVLHLDLGAAKTAVSVSASIALYFADLSSARLPALLRLTRQGLEIPAGSTTFTATDSFELPVDVDVETIQVHAKDLARQVNVTALTPDKREVPLLSVSEWDAAGQRGYRFAKPVRLPKGATLAMSIRYDNSRSNVNNPSSPAIAVRLGQRDEDDMAEIWMRVQPLKADDRPALIEAMRQHVVPEDIRGRAFMARDEPRNAALRDALAIALADSGDLAGAEREFRVSQSLQPNAAAARFNVGMAALGQARQPEAERWFASALDIDPQHPLSHLQVGLQSQARGEVETAAFHLTQAAAARPHDPSVLLAAGVVNVLTGQIAQATAQMRHALEVRPEWANAEAALALVLSSGPGHSREEQQEAVELAERVNERTHHTVAAYLDILAGALDAAGERERALAAAREALALAEEAGDRTAAETMRGRIAEWERRLP